MMQSQAVTVISRKFDGSVSRSWQCSLVEERGPLLVLVGEFAFDADHSDLGLIPRGTVSYEYYWLNRWYNVFRFLEPGGNLRNWYCNVNTLPTFRNGVLDYVDLDIDVLIWPGRDPIVLDEQEFQVNAEKYEYPANLRAAALAAKDDLLSAFDRREFPFDTYTQVFPGRG